MLAASRYCSNCGAANPSSAVSCLGCGLSLKATVPLPLEPKTAAITSYTAHLKPNQLLEERYHIVSQVGTGGFGAVYKAEDTQDGNRLVAVKEIGLSGLTSQQVIEATDAFNREVMLLSDLKHPNIPRIYAHFTDPKHWYLVMDFVEGETLEEYRLKAPGACLPLEQVLDLGIQLCSVLDYLHSHEPPVIFRDVKPTNVMLTPAGKLYLIDFGVARYFKPGKVRDTIAFGSPGFAAPEQYGKAQTTPRSDIYSLGVTLYQLLTGTDPSLTPFRFVSLCILDQAIPAELDTLIMQMLEMDASKRPASMANVKQELQHITTQQQVGKAGISPAGGLQKQAVGAAQAMVTFSIQGVTLYIYRGHHMRVKTVAWSPGGRHIASGGNDNTVYVWDADTKETITSHHGQSDMVKTVAWSPDGQWIASASIDHSTRIWDSNTKKTIFTYRNPSYVVHAVAWSPDGKYIALGSSDRTVLIWDIAANRKIFTYRGHSDSVHAVAWSPDGKHIVSAGDDHTAQVWDAVYQAGTSQIQSTFTYRYHSGSVRTLVWSPCGQRVASAGADRTVRVWQAG